MSHRSRSWIVSGIVGVGLTMSVAVTSAQEGDVGVVAGELGEPEHGPGNNAVGVKFINLNALHAKHGAEGDSMEISPHFGGTMFYERAFFHHRIETELNAVVTDTEGGVRVPLEVLVKVMFLDPTSSVRPFIGAGPALHLLLTGEEKDAFFEVAATVGCVIWFNESLGLDVELDYGLVFEEELVQEIGPSIGPVFQF